MQRFLELIEPVWKPHDGQREFLLNPAKFKVLACGRRWGKTDACAVQAVQALHRPFPTKHLILAPTSDQASLLFDRVVQVMDLMDSKPKVKRSPYHQLRFGPHTLMARSGHVPRSLRGHEATHIVVDEAAYLPESLITEVAMPMLATSDGHLTLVSTPHGKNHFWRFFQMGQRGENGIWSRSAPSSESPFVSESFLAVQRQLISQRAFAVEYEAQFMDSVGQVFKAEAVQDCLVPSVGAGAEPFLVGIDWARYSDFTAIAVLSGNRESTKLMCLHKFNNTNWTEIVRRVAEVVVKFPNARVSCDKTGAGDVVVEELRKLLPYNRIDALNFTNANKGAMIDNLVWLFERRVLKMAPDPDLLRELDNFQATETASGKTRLSATSGYHDDLVIALALAAKDLPAEYRPTIQIGKPRNFSQAPKDKGPTP